MSARTLKYELAVRWRGAREHGTRSYSSYGRDFEIGARGIGLTISADAHFRGDPARLNPEDLLLASASVCHALTYLALCAQRGVAVLAYEDEPRGTLPLDAEGIGEFALIRLAPRVTIRPDADAGLAHALHDVAGTRCFVARSLRTRVTHDPRIELASAVDAVFRP